MPQVSEMSLNYPSPKGRLLFQEVFLSRRRNMNIFLHFSSPFCSFCHAEMTDFWMPGSDMLTEDQKPRWPPHCITDLCHQNTIFGGLNPLKPQKSQPVLNHKQTCLLSDENGAPELVLNVLHKPDKCSTHCILLFKCLHAFAGGSNLFGKDCSDPEVGILCCHLIRQQTAPAQNLFQFQYKTKQVKKQAKFLFPNGFYI